MLSENRACRGYSQDFPCNNSVESRKANTFVFNMSLMRGLAKTDRF